MDLTPRLKIIADSICGYDSVADIGSDHAYLPIYLVKNRNVKRVIASDVNKGPVEISRARVKRHGAEGVIEIRRGNGLEVLTPGETEVIVIAGMGGMLIIDILEKGKSAAKAAKLLVLQPMRDSGNLRKWLLENGFGIIDEELVKEQDKIYEVIWVMPGYRCRKSENLMPIGDRIIEKKHPLAAEFIDKKIEELEKVVYSLKDKDTENSIARKEECRNLIRYYREVRRWVQ